MFDYLPTLTRARLYTALIRAVSPKGKAVSRRHAPPHPDQRLDEGKKPCNTYKIRALSPHLTTSLSHVCMCIVYVHARVSVCTCMLQPPLPVFVEVGSDLGSSLLW